MVKILDVLQINGPTKSMNAYVSKQNKPGVDQKPIIIKSIYQLFINSWAPSLSKFA